MIVRLWRGRTSLQSADAYQTHVTMVVLPKLIAIAGYLGVRVLRRETLGEVEFLVLTEWASWDAIRSFAGVRPEVAVVESAAKALLTYADEHVQHFESVHTTGAAPHRSWTDG